MKIRSRRRGARVVGLVAGVALVGGLAATAAPASAAGKPESPGSQAEGVIAGAWIVTLKDGQSPRGVSAEHARNHNAQVDHVYEHALRGYAARMSETAAARVARDSRVVSVEPDRPVRLSAKPVRGGSTPMPAETDLPGLKRIGALASPSWNSTTAPAVDVAVIDTGIAAHPDLDVVGGVNCNGRGSSFSDGNGHGTHVAGTIGAKRDDVGVVGVAPGVRLHAVRVLNNRGSGSWSDVACGIDWVAAQREVVDGVEQAVIEVANMSLSASLSSPDTSTCVTPGVHSAICKAIDAGTTFVVAAGNDGIDAAYAMPASYDEVLTVSALADSDGAPGGHWPTSGVCTTGQVEDNLASFSNFGPDVDLIAPGVCIRSTWLSGGYNTISGTSMAAPHAAGAAALWISAQPSRPSPADVAAALTNAGSGDWFGDRGQGGQEPRVDVSRF